MKKRKVVSVLLILVLAVSLIACKKDTDETSGKDVSTEVDNGAEETQPTPEPTAEPTEEPVEVAEEELEEPVVEIVEKDAFALIEIEALDVVEVAGLEDCSDENGGKNLGGIKNGSYAGFSKVNFGNGGLSKVAFRASSGMEDGGDIEVHLGSVDGTLIGTCHITNTGDWHKWETFEFDVPELASVTGLQDIYLVFTNGGDWLFNLNWFQFSKGPRNAAAAIEAEDFDEAFDLVAEGQSDGDSKGIGGINNGDYSAYTIDFGDGGYKKVIFRAATDMPDGGEVEIRLNGVEGELLGTCRINGTGGWSNWEEFTGDIEGLSAITGVQKVVLVYTNGGDWLFNINWFQFSK